jgi:hypothetical protein
MTYKFFVGVLKVKDEKSRSRIHWSEARIRIRTKMSRIHNTAKKCRRSTKIIFLHVPQFCHETHALDSCPDDLICNLS